MTPPKDLREGERRKINDSVARVGNVPVSKRSGTDRRSTDRRQGARRIGMSATAQVIDGETYYNGHIARFRTPGRRKEDER